MRSRFTRRIPLAVGVALALAVLALAFPASANPGAPNPGHLWTELENHGTSGSDYWLGPTTNNALELRVNGQRALRLEPNATSPNVIGGYSGNSVTAGAYAATISGGGSSGDANQATASYATVAGGWKNQAGYNAGTTTDSRYATVGGGGNNTASGVSATVAGGGNNTASNNYATVGGGLGNTASVDNSTVGGGDNNAASGSDATVGGGQSNQAGYYATVGGGNTNTASGGHATVGGGHVNTASGAVATVGGGDGNRALGDRATVGGGYSNTASGINLSTVGGGGGNTASSGGSTVGGGDTNMASGGYATVGGGYGNTASGQYSTVPGGADNIASGSDSFAAGWNALAYHDGDFVWADATGGYFAADGANVFLVRASGGTYFYSNPNASIGVALAPGSNAWAPMSDRNVKANFTSVDGQDILNRLASIPVETWNLKSQDTSIRHMGPMAQDFYAAFGLGEDDLHITTVDADGVALAAIQGLYQLVQETRAENADLEARIVQLEAGSPTSQVAAAAAGSPGLPPAWPLLGGGLALALVGLVLGRRLAAGPR